LQFILITNAFVKAT